jgi:hypothetical protein
MQISNCDLRDCATENPSSDTARAACIPPSSQAGERPDLIVDSGDLPAAARKVRDSLARSGGLSRHRVELEPWIQRAKAVRIEDEIARRGIRLAGKTKRMGPCPKASSSV